MAIEDEIINITDIDVGTEILNTDQLIIETNNGTKLLAFKDLVIGEDNITFKDKLVQGADATGASSTTTSVVTGYNILTSDTTAGHLTKYADISGTVELGKFNYSGVSKFAELSATIAANQASIALANDNLTSIYNQLQNTSSTDLNSITITLSATNFKVGTSTSANNGTKGVGFSDVDLNPITTNPSCTFTENPLKIIYPSDNSFNASWILFIGDIITSWSSGANQHVHMYVKKVDNTSSRVATASFSRVGSTLKQKATIQTFQYISPSDEITLLFTGHKNTATEKGSNFAGVKIG